MASNDRGVPRGDHVASERDKADSVERQDANARGGTAGWGGAPAGGSVIDKRSPDKKG